MILPRRTPSPSFLSAARRIGGGGAMAVGDRRAGRSATSAAAGAGAMMMMMMSSSSSLPPTLKSASAHRQLGGRRAAQAACAIRVPARGVVGGAFAAPSRANALRMLPRDCTASMASMSTNKATASAIANTGRYLSSSSSTPDGGGQDGDASATTKITLPNKTGDRDGLVRHEVVADDGHPLRLYSRNPRDGCGGVGGGIETNDRTKRRQRSILLLHGRTWSSQPVFDLRTSPDDEKRQSTLQSLADLGFHAYALDLRGFGETPRGYHDESDGSGGYTTPRRCVADVKCAIDWMTRRHHNHRRDEEAGGDATTSTTTIAMDPTVVDDRPALLGWSQGALVAQMYAQQHGPATLSDLVLFGSIYDPKVIYPRKPLYDPSGRMVSGGPDVPKPPPPTVRNTDVDSLEDFTLPGTICDEAAMAYSDLGMAVDEVKAAWDELHEFNVLNPALVHVPTLVIAGAQDPYVSWDAQRELFERLGTEDRAMCVLPGCDHAAHILKARKMFVRGVVGFLLRKDSF